MSEILQGEKLINEIKNTLRPSVDGVDQLTRWLESTLCPLYPSSLNNETGLNEHFRLFRNGQTESIIRLHTAPIPPDIKVWYADLSRRAAPEIVKNTMRTFFNIFFSDTFKPNEPPFLDLYQKEKHLLLEKTFFVNNEILPTDRESSVIKKLLQEKPAPRKILGTSGTVQYHEHAISVKSKDMQPFNEESENKKTLLKN